MKLQLFKNTIQILVTLAFVITFIGAITVNAQKTVEKEATDKEKKEQIFKKMEQRLKKNKQLKDGWQSVFTTKKGTVLYGFVKNKKITNYRVGTIDTKDWLPASGSYNQKPTSPIPPGDPPTEGECRNRAWSCIWNDSGNCNSFWGNIKFLRKIISIDLEGLEQQLDAQRECVEACIGDACRQILF